MKDARILTSSAGSTAGRGSSTERNLRTSMTENASRGIASPQGTARKGTAPPLWSFSASFREKPWNLCNAFILFVCFQFKHSVHGWRKVHCCIVIGPCRVVMWNIIFVRVSRTWSFSPLLAAEGHCHPTQGQDTGRGSGSGTYERRTGVAAVTVRIIMEDHPMTDLRTSGADLSVTATAPHHMVRWSAHAVERQPWDGLPPLGRRRWRLRILELVCNWRNSRVKSWHRWQKRLPRRPRASDCSKPPPSTTATSASREEAGD